MVSPEPRTISRPTNLSRSGAASGAGWCAKTRRCGDCVEQEDMKKHDRNEGVKRIRAFTLMEMLVVMAIISILAALVFLGLQQARHTANIRRAQAEARELSKAWQMYWKLYGEWPFGAVDVPMNKAAMDVLQGKDATYNAQLIRFLDVDYNAVEEEQGYRDPWGNYYRVDFSRTPIDFGTEYYEVTVQFPQANRFLDQ